LAPAGASASAGVFQPLVGETAMVMIDMKVELRKFFMETTGRFQRTHDGQFVGKVVFNGEEIECWLVFDDNQGPQKNPDFLKLSFTTPYPYPVR
jgi:hypothetical protein